MMMMMMMMIRDSIDKTERKESLLYPKTRSYKEIHGSHEPAERAISCDVDPVLHGHSDPTYVYRLDRHRKVAPRDVFIPLVCIRQGYLSFQIQTTCCATC
jgi:hypothetical protein